MEHVYELRTESHGNRYLQNAWNKYGESSFSIEMIEKYNTLEEMNNAEVDLIKNNPDNYNITKGGTGFVHDDCTKKVIGEASMIPVIAVNVITGELKEYSCAQASIIDGFDPKCVRKCAVRYICPKGSGGRKYTVTSTSHRGWVWIDKDKFSLEEILVRVAIAKQGKVKNERAVMGKSMETGEILVFKSSKEATKMLGISCVYAACQYKRVKTAGNYVWCHCDTPEPQSLLEERYLETVCKRNRAEANKIKKPAGKSVVGMNIDTGEIRKYAAAIHAEKDGFFSSLIGNVANKTVRVSKSGYPYTSLSHRNWVWAKDSENVLEELKEMIKIAKACTKRGYKTL